VLLDQREGELREGAEIAERRERRHQRLVAKKHAQRLQYSQEGVVLPAVHKRLMMQAMVHERLQEAPVLLLTKGVLLRMRLREAFQQRRLLVRIAGVLRQDLRQPRARPSPFLLLRHPPRPSLLRDAECFNGHPRTSTLIVRIPRTTSSPSTSRPPSIFHKIQRADAARPN